MHSLQIAFANPELTRPVPTSITLSLKSIDGLQDHQHNTTNITQEGDLIVVEVIPGLPSNRLWNCTILAYGCRQNKLLSEIELSTHDIQNISVSSPLSGQVRVTGDFLEGSTATGVLVTLVNEGDVQHHLSTRGSNENEVESVIAGLAAGQYTVSVFVVDMDGIPLERTATKPRQVTVEGGSVGKSQSLTIEYKLKSTSTGVCITCTFLESSTTACVAVVHQRISQLSSSGLMNIESSHKLTRSGDTSHECVEGIDVDNYQVEVIGAIQVDLPENGSWVCGTTCIAIIVSGLALSFLIVVIGPFMVICFICKQVQPCKKKQIISRNVHDHSHPRKNMKSDYNNIQIDSKAVLTEDSTAAPSSPLLSRVDRTEERSEFVNDKKQEIDSNESAAIDTEEILVVDEVRAPGTPQVDIHVGPDKVMSESSYIEEPGSNKETLADQTDSNNKDKVTLLSPTTNVQLEGKQAELADEVLTNNDMKTAPEGNTDILQMCKAEAGSMSETPAEQVIVAEDKVVPPPIMLKTNVEPGGKQAESTGTTSEILCVKHVNEDSDPTGFQPEPVAHSTPRKQQYGHMQTDSSASETIIIYHNSARYTRENYSCESGQRKAYITHEGESDKVDEVLDASEQSIVQPGHNSSCMTKVGEDEPPEADSDYASMPVSCDVDSHPSNEPDSEMIKAEYEFKTDKAPQQKITPVPNDIMVGNVSNSYYVPGDSGVGTCNLGVTSDTFTMFSEDKSCQTTIGVHKPFMKLEDGGYLKDIKSKPVQKPIQD